MRESRGDLFKFLGTFALVNSFLFALFIFRYGAYISFENSFLQYLYVGATTIGHLGVIPLAIVIPSLLLALTYRKFSIVALFSSLLFTLGILFITVDSFVFSQYRFHVNQFVLDMLLGAGAGDIFQFSIWSYVVTIAFIALLYLFQFLIGYFIWKKKIYQKIKVKTYVFLVIGMMLVSHLVHAYAHASSYTTVTRSAHVYPAYFPLTANSLFTKLHLIDLEEQAKNKVYSNHKSTKSIKYPLEKLQFQKGDNYNVLFVVIDCWRADCFNADITPNIYNFSKQGIQFTYHHSGSNGTRGGIFSMFYGMPGFAYWNTMKQNEIRPVFMKKMQEENYKFGIFSSSNVINPAFNKTVFAGIDSLRLRTVSENSAPYARDAKVTEEWLAFMDKNYSAENKQPFFGFLFYDAAHGYSHPDPKNAPFQPSWLEPNYLQLNNDTNPKPFFNLFKNSIHYLDSLVAKVLGDLEKRQLLDKTIVVFTGDHGQEFNDNKKNYWGHGSNFAEYQTHVPMIVCWPGKEAKTYTHKTLHYDLASTIMTDNLGCKSDPKSYSMGQMLWNTSERDYFVAGGNDNYAIIEDDQITVTLYGSYSLTDSKMKALDNSKLHSRKVFEAMKESYRFFAK
jgi:membrane-anchored protein YejM (alkaline phosphatase superfamily)